ncbi:MAG: helix-turn-helix transcriptional regulator [Thermoleophilia bacterium]
MVGDNIRRIRTAKRPKMSQEKLARLADVSRQTIYDLENDRRQNTTENTIERIAAALGVPSSELRQEPKAKAS